MPDSVDPEKVKAMAARVARGLAPTPQEDETVCRRPGCEQSLGHDALDGVCGPCARDLQIKGQWSTRTLWDRPGAGS